MENSASTRSRVTQGLGGGGAETKGRKKCCLKQEASSTVVFEGYYQDTKMSVVEVTTKKSWPERKRRRIGTIGLTVLGP
jgi:hypothetical protein